jgi:hypothetical protein
MQNVRKVCGMDMMRLYEVTRRIEEILKKRNSKLVNYISGVTDIKTVDYNIRKDIAEELGNEFCEEGVRPDSEPNEYGLEIEDLIDACGLG